MFHRHLILCLVLFHQIPTIHCQAINCKPIYTVKPNATCWRQFPGDPVDECSHKFCYELTEGTTKCSDPWKKSTIHREHELERIATLARNKFITQQSCTMKLKVNRNSKSNLLFFKNEDDCLGLETFTFSQDSCAVVHLNRALRGYCIWYHNVCPKVPTDVTVCKRDKYSETPEPTNSQRQSLSTPAYPKSKSAMGIEIIIIVAVSANFVILIVVALLVSFLLKRSRASNRHDQLTQNPSNRPLPNVPCEFGKTTNHRMSKADSAEFDKWKDESHYMYLSHDSVDAPRYHSITKKDEKNIAASDYSYPDLEQVRKPLQSDKTCYMGLMKVEKQNNAANEVQEHSEKLKISETLVLEKDNLDKSTDKSRDMTVADNHPESNLIAYSDAEADYSELKPDYYVLEENDKHNEQLMSDGTVQSMNKPLKKDQNCENIEEIAHDYFQLENDEKSNGTKKINSDDFVSKCSEPERQESLEVEGSTHEYFELEEDEKNSMNTAPEEKVGSLDESQKH